MSEVSGYPSNSNKKKAPPEKKQIQKVVTGEIVQTKKGLGKRIAETFAGDDMHSVGSYILFDVMLPAAKTTISDAISQGIDRLLFGESRQRSSGSSIYKPGYTSYNRMAGSAVRKDEPLRTVSKKIRAAHDFDQVAFFDRIDAQKVLDGMMAVLEQYDVVTVNDYYDLIGVSGEFTDEKWGWTDLRQAEIRRGRDGFHLLLPPTSPID